MPHGVVRLQRRWRRQGGKVTISVGDKPIAEGRIENTIPFRISLDETLDIGEDTGTPVSKDYKVPFRFTGISIASSCVWAIPADARRRGADPPRDGRHRSVPIKTQGSRKHDRTTIRRAYDQCSRCRPVKRPQQFSLNQETALTRNSQPLTLARSDWS